VSLYRQPGGYSPRTLAAALIAVALVGGVIGFLVGRGSVEDRSAADAVADARAELRPVAAGLELVPIEYEGALRGNGVARTELDAARGAASRAEAELAAVAEDMRAIDAAGYAAATRAVAQLAAAVDATASPARVKALASRASDAAEALSGA
jgi:hypothetical protein